MSTCDTIATNIISSFGKGFEVESDDGGCIVITPFLRSNFDHIQFYVETSRGKIAVTDDGDTIGDLFLQGLDVTTEKPIYREIAKIAARYRLVFHNYVLSTETTEENLGDASLRLLNAMQAVSYLVYKISAKPRSGFVNQVETFLLDQKIAYTPQLVISGNTVKSNKFSYYVNGTRNMLIDAMSAKSINSARTMAIKGVFKWGDVRAAGINMNFAALLDDRSGQEIWRESEALSILYGNFANVVFWSERKDKLVSLLTDDSTIE